MPFVSAFTTGFSIGFFGFNDDAGQGGGGGAAGASGAAGGQGGSGASASKRGRNIPPIRLNRDTLHFPKTWEEHNRILGSFQFKRGEHGGDVAAENQRIQEAEDRRLQEEEKAIRSILRKAYSQ